MAPSIDPIPAKLAWETPELLDLGAGVDDVLGAFGAASDTTAHTPS